jgi:hypothetical protein
VTHSLGLVEKMCDDVLWLRAGKVEGRGDPKRVVDAYLTYVAGGEEELLSREHGRAPVEPGSAPMAAPGETEAGHGYREGRWGDREVEIARVRLLDARGRERHVYAPGEPLTLAMDVRARQPTSDFVFGVGLFTADGVAVYGTNTHLEDYVSEALEGEAEVRFEIGALRLVEGSYLIDVAAHKRDGTPYDYHRGLYSFRVRSHTKDVGVHRPEHRWSFAGSVAMRSPLPRPELELGEE